MVSFECTTVIFLIYGLLHDAQSIEKYFLFQFLVVDIETYGQGLFEVLLSYELIYVIATCLVEVDHFDYSYFFEGRTVCHFFHFLLGFVFKLGIQSEDVLDYPLDFELLAFGSVFADEDAVEGS